MFTAGRSPGKANRR